jgi:hypothetical protein
MTIRGGASTAHNPLERCTSGRSAARASWADVIAVGDRPADRLEGFFSPVRSSTGCTLEQRQRKLEQSRVGVLGFRRVGDQQREGARSVAGESSDVIHDDVQRSSSFAPKRLPVKVACIHNRSAYGAPRGATAETRRRCFRMRLSRKSVATPSAKSARRQRPS